MKKIIQHQLKILAKIILAKYQPKIIGITGSVGKTSAREAVYAVLSPYFSVRRSAKNYNNEIGVPLTIIDDKLESRKSFINWLKIFSKAAQLIIKKDKNYPKILILEMGVDRPGDMDYLNSIVKCDIGVITMIGPVHIEFFNSVKRIKKEKSKLIHHLDNKGWAILNYDNKESRDIKEESKAKVLTYGLEEKADVVAKEIRFNFSGTDKISNKSALNSLYSINFKLSYQGSFVPVILKGVIGKNAIYAALAGASVGIANGLNLVEIAESLKNFRSPKGRMNLIKGIKHTLIIDDTYNASPQAMKASLEIAKKIPLAPNARFFAVLGDMLELGKRSEREHYKIGQYCAQLGVDKLITIGERSRDIGRGAKENGMVRDNVFHFGDLKMAGKFLQDRIKQGDLILVKGSQGVRMEKIVKEIMADPLKADKLLVRQGPEWNN